MINRLFISLDLPDSVKEQLISERDKNVNTPNNIKWEHDDKLHITLKFLGDVGENITELMEHRFNEIVIEKIKCEFTNFSFFAKNGIPKILFAGFKENDELINVHKKIEKECELLGFSREKRRFMPHVTLMRIKENTNVSLLKNINNHPINIEPFNIETFSLMKSTLKPTGSVYSKVKSFKLL